MVHEQLSQFLQTRSIDKHFFGVGVSTGGLIMMFGGSRLLSLAHAEQESTLDESLQPTLCCDLPGGCSRNFLLYLSPSCFPLNTIDTSAVFRVLVPFLLPFFFFLLSLSPLFRSEMK